MSVDTSNPFVGLRPYEVEESLLFFGRNDQTMELLQRLHKHHFVAVVGSSGCGKSSLLRAGLIPSLKAGFLVQDSDHWLFTIMKPGQSPLYNLAESLLIQINANSDQKSIVDFVQKMREEGSDAIVELVTPVWKEKNINFFLLVDQFEELFRFAMEQNDIARKDEAIDFVNIMLELSQQKLIPFYVVMTMRSDFIGDCAKFFGLPEAMNQSQYLVPRLTRSQLKTVIESPAKLYGGKLNALLTSRLLNSLGKVTDELPLLQHALMRIWDYEKKVDKNTELDLSDYDGVGGLEGALSKHAEEALVGMSEADLLISKKIFQSLTAIDDNGRKIRRPVTLGQLEGLTNASQQKLIEIIQLFNSDKRSFLIVSNAANPKDKVIDISHEALIRQWDTLGKWVDEEGETAAIYLQLAEALRLSKLKKRDYLEGTELQIMLEWYKKYEPTANWANRYKAGFEEAKTYLFKSEELENARIAEQLKKENEEKEQLRIDEERIRVEKRRKIKQKVLSGAIVILILFVCFAIQLMLKAKKAELDAKKEKLNVQIANNETKDLLKLVMKGRGVQYTDSELIKQLNKDRNYPIDSVIKPMGSISRLNDGSNNRNYLMWIDVPTFRRNEIKEVQYNLCEGFADRKRISDEPSSSFSVGYLGWGYCAYVNIDVILVNGDTVKCVFSFNDYLKKHPAK